MPFELNIRVAPIAPTHAWYTNEAERDWRAYRAGNIISVKPFGWSAGAHWADSAYNFEGQNLDSGYFVCVVCPDGPEPSAIRGYLDREWRDDFEFTITAQNATQGRYTAQVRNANVSASGKAALTRAKIENYLLGWAANNITFSTNQVTFNISLWNAVRSWRFWDYENIDSVGTFTLVSYNATSGIGRIKFTITNAQLNSDQISTSIGIKISERGGTIVSQVFPDFVFDVERSDLFDKFKNDVKRTAERVFRRRRYQLTDAIINKICADAMASGGRAEYTWAEIQSALLDGLSE